MRKERNLTPWEVKGRIDYEDIIKKFGLSRLDTKLLKRIENIF
ncbi:MAG: hypothetical protein QXU40_02825 [Candidatus Pacearchaeota archaeon]